MENFIFCAVRVVKARVTQYMNISKGRNAMNAFLNHNSALLYFMDVS